MVAFLISGCIPSLQEKADEDAKIGLAARLTYTTDSLRLIVAERRDLQGVTDDDLRSAFMHDLRGYDWVELPKGGPGTSLYDLTSKGDEGTFSVYFTGDGFEARGLEVANVTRYGCAQIVGVFRSDRLSIRDVYCPLELAEWRGKGTLDTSMSQVAREHSVNVEIVRGTRTPSSVFHVGGAKRNGDLLPRGCCTRLFSESLSGRVPHALSLPVRRKLPDLPTMCRRSRRRARSSVTADCCTTSITKRSKRSKAHFLVI